MVGGIGEWACGGWGCGLDGLGEGGQGARSCTAIGLGQIAATTR